jgi:hypothetical protein
MKRAIVRIPTYLVHSLLRLPSNVSIAGFHVEPKREGITLRLRGPGLPENCTEPDPACVCPEVVCMYETRTVAVHEFKGFS